MDNNDSDKGLCSVVQSPQHSLRVNVGDDCIVIEPSGIRGDVGLAALPCG